jgi:hypothetical protein
VCPVSLVNVRRISVFEAISSSDRIMSRTGKQNFINGKDLVIRQGESENGKSLGSVGIELEYLLGIRKRLRLKHLFIRALLAIFIWVHPVLTIHDSKVHQVLVIGYERLRTIMCVALRNISALSTYTKQR